jgi:hypothetical protein
MKNIDKIEETLNPSMEWIGQNQWPFHTRLEEWMKNEYEYFNVRSTKN